MRFKLGNWKGKTAGWRQLLRDNNIRWLYAGQLISQVGDGVSKVALLWFVYQMTESAFKMTLIGVLQTVPPLLFGPLAGVYLDRVSKRGAMIAIDVSRTALLATIPILYALGLLTLTWLYVLVFVLAMFSMAFGPAMSATLPLLAKNDQLTRINALMQSAMTIGLLLGPALSGILIAAIGAHNALYVNAAGFFVSALCKIPLRVPGGKPNRIGSPLASRTWEDLRQGFRFIFVEHRLLFLLMIVASIFSFGETAFVALLPVVGDRILHVGSVALGWLWSSLSIGILAATAWLFLKKQPDVCRRVWIIAGAAALGGAAGLVLLTHHSAILAAGSIAVIGGSSGLITPLISASLQERTPKAMLARVFGVFNTGTMAFATIGMSALGWAADRFGPAVSLTAIGTVKLAAAAIAISLVPWCHRLEKQSRGRSSSALKHAA